MSQDKPDHYPPPEMQSPRQHSASSTSSRSALSAHRSALPLTQRSSLRILMVAGEASGDKHGAALVRALMRLYPETKFEVFGSGGDEMRAAGVETLIDARDVAIIGIPEIVRALGRFYRAYHRLIDAARSRAPHAIVLIDWPDFNLRLARRLRREGFKIVYYISPQVWAWRKYRVRAIRRDVDRMLVILPFEKDFYQGAGVEVEYVGHPLADAVHLTSTREEFAGQHGLDPARPFIALLPGSRHKEIHYHLPAMLDAARRLRIADFQIADFQVADFQVADFQIADCGSRIADSARAPQFVVVMASTASRSQVDAILKQAGDDDLNIRVIERDTYNALGHSEIAVIASGTATVEAALMGTPMVIVYRASEINWRLIRPLIHLDTFGMANLIAGRRIVPELIQHDVTGEKIAREVAAILCDPARVSKMRQELAVVRERLTADGGSGPERAALALMRAISQTRPTR